MMEQNKVMERFMGFINQVVEEEKAKVSSKVDLDSIGEWVETASKEDLMKLVESLKNNEFYNEIMDDEFRERLEDDEDYIRKDDIDMDTVDDLGLLEDCYNEYVDRHGAKDVIIDLLDSL